MNKIQKGPILTYAALILVSFVSVLTVKSQNDRIVRVGEMDDSSQFLSDFSNSRSGAFNSILEEIDIDIVELIRNIRDVEFVYKNAKIPLDPSMPLLRRESAIANNPRESPGVVRLDDRSLAYLTHQKVVSWINFNDDNPMAIVDRDIVFVGYEYRVTPDAEPIIVKSINMDSVVFKIPSEDTEVTKILVTEH